MDKAKIKCPQCHYMQVIDIPESSCLPFYQCEECKNIISAPADFCCVICAYSDKKCPVGK